MAKYIVVLTRKAQKQFDKIPDTIASPLLSAIAKLSDTRGHMVTKNSMAEMAIE